jgi:hypothetical protein
MCDLRSLLIVYLLTRWANGRLDVDQPASVPESRTVDRVSAMARCPDALRLGGLFKGAGARDGGVFPSRARSVSGFRQSARRVKMSRGGRPK